MISRMMSTAAIMLILVLSAPPLVNAESHAEKEIVGGTGSFGISLDAGVESWSGDITYQIGFPVTDAWGYTYNGYFPFSELTFPLDVTFGVVKAELTLIDKYQIGLKVKKNVTDPDDYMEDRDWITPADASRLDIYSDSGVTDFTATVIDVDAGYRIVNSESISLAAGLGYMYQDFEYETAVIRQWSPSGLQGFDYVGDGRNSIIYEVDCKMPYLFVSGSLSIIPSLRINGRLAFAPWVDIDDRDQHLLRSKVNTGDLEGTAVMVSVDAEYDVTPQFFLAAGLDYTDIEADGDMDAYFFGIYDHTVAEEFESNQTSLFAKVGFRFGASGQ